MAKTIVDLTRPEDEGGHFLLYGYGDDAVEVTYDVARMIGLKGSEHYVIVTPVDGWFRSCWDVQIVRVVEKINLAVSGVLANAGTLTIDAPRMGDGSRLSYGSKIYLDGVEQKGIRALTLNIRYDEPITVSVEKYV